MYSKMSVLQWIYLLPWIIIYIYIILTYDSIVACCIRIISQIQCCVQYTNRRRATNRILSSKFRNLTPLPAQKLISYRSRYFCTNAYTYNIYCTYIYIWVYIKAVSWTLGRFYMMIKWFSFSPIIDRSIFIK